MEVRRQIADCRIEIRASREGLQVSAIHLLSLGTLYSAFPCIPSAFCNPHSAFIEHGLH